MEMNRIAEPKMEENKIENEGEKEGGGKGGVEKSKMGSSRRDDCTTHKKPASILISSGKA